MKMVYPIPLLVTDITKKYLINKNSKINIYMKYQRSSYSSKFPNYFKIILYKRRVYVPLILHRNEIDCYHCHLNHPGGGTLYKNTKNMLLKRPYKTILDFI